MTLWTINRAAHGRRENYAIKIIQIKEGFCVCESGFTMYEFFKIDDRVLKAAEEAEQKAAPYLAKISETQRYNQEKMQAAFMQAGVSESHFVATTGYGYGDRGRDVLDEVYARALGAEDALCRYNFVSGTHTLTVALFGVLRPGDTMLSVTGMPYDTLRGVIGITGDGNGSLKEFGINYEQLDLLPDGTPDYDGMETAITPKHRMVYIQRSRGYSLRPSLTVEEIGPDGYVFTALIDLYPEVKLGQYKGLSAVYPQAELSEEDTQAALEEYARAHLDVTHPDRAAMGDEVVLDFEGFVDGVAFESGKGESYPLLLGSGYFIPGFEEQVAGACVNEERDVHVTFPTAYTPELAGKDATFRIKVHEITRRSMPTLDDAFAKAQGFEELSQLRRAVMEQAVAKKQKEAAEQFANDLIAQVLDGMEVQLPDAMVENQLDGLIQELRGHLQSQNVELEQYLEASGASMEELRAHAREQAVSAARFELAMTEIARLEGIDVTDAEVEQKYNELSAQYQLSADLLRQQLPPMRLRHDLKLARAQAVIVDTARRK